MKTHRGVFSFLYSLRLRQNYIRVCGPICAFKHQFVCACDLYICDYEFLQIFGTTNHEAMEYIPCSTGATANII